MAASKAERLQNLREMLSRFECAQYDEADSLENVLDGQEAFDRIIKLTAVRDRSRSELRKRLRDEGFLEEEIDSALYRACSCNLVDDKRFADARIRYLVRDGRGISGIRRDMDNFGIDLSEVPGWPCDYVEGTSENELERALIYIERKPSRSNNVLRGSYQKLVRHGYSSDVAMRAATIVNNKISA